MREMTVEQRVAATIRGVLQTECSSKCMDDLDDIDDTVAALMGAIESFLVDCDEPLHDDKDGCPRCSK